MFFYLLARETYVQCIRAMEVARKWIVTGMINARRMCEKSKRTFDIVGMSGSDHIISAKIFL